MLPKGGDMTRASMREYSEAMRWRYLQALKKETGKILDEFTKMAGYHRKAIIRLLHQVNQPNANRKPGHPRQYNADVVLFSTVPLDTRLLSVS